MRALPREQGGTCQGTGRGRKGGPRHPCYSSWDSSGQAVPGFTGLPVSDRHVCHRERLASRSQLQQQLEEAAPQGTDDARRHDRAAT